MLLLAGKFPLDHYNNRIIRLSIPFNWVGRTLSNNIYISACQSGNYGNGCSHICGNCAAGEPCHHEDGSCSNGCAVGWTGPTCKDRMFVMFVDVMYFAYICL